MNIKNTFKDNIKFNQHFEQYFKSLNNKELKIIFDIMEVIFRKIIIVIILIRLL